MTAQAGTVGRAGPAGHKRRYKGTDAVIVDLWFLAIAAPAVVFAGISKGGFGSGAAFAAAMVLALVIPPHFALGVMLPLLMLMDAATLRPFWGKWNRQAAVLLILGGVPGVILGVGVYRMVDQDAIRLMIGGIAIGFSVWKLLEGRGWISPPRRALPRHLGFVAGIAAGFTSFVSHAGGPPVAVYLLSQRLGKSEFQATTVLVFWAINLVKFLPYAGLGFFSVQTGFANLVLAPFALLGVYLGVRAHHLMPERLFFAVTYALLIATGTKLIWDGGQGMLG